MLPVPETLCRPLTCTSFALRHFLPTLPLPFLWRSPNCPLLVSLFLLSLTSPPFNRLNKYLYLSLSLCRDSLASLTGPTPSDCFLTLSLLRIWSLVFSVCSLSKQFHSSRTIIHCLCAGDSQPTLLPAPSSELLACTSSHSLGISIWAALQSQQYIQSASSLLYFSLGLMTTPPSGGTRNPGFALDSVFILSNTSAVHPPPFPTVYCP